MNDVRNTETASKIHDVYKRLMSSKYACIPGEIVADLLSVDKKEVSYFKEYWNHLEIDRFMADGGDYRYRRYGQFLKSNENRFFSALPHEPYVQPSNINTLNGDTVRHFEPLSDDFMSSPVLNKLLFLITDICDLLEGGAQNWNIRLHPYRIIATKNTAGKPTPEGLHRDGVNYITSLMINYNNVFGGQTTITDEKKNIIDEFMLNKPLDLLIADDEVTMHKVSPITPEYVDDIAYRDVLVIAFIKI